MLRIRLMTAADVSHGMRFKEQNDWNQLEMDWHRFLALEPDGCFVADRDGIAVGTTCTCVFDTVAWIAMVLVDNAHRGLGIGTALMSHALTYLDKCSIRSVRLDATPLGRPIYEKLGFVAEYRLARHEGILPVACGDHVAGVEPMDSKQAEQRQRVIEWDRFVTGTNRCKLLERLFDEWPEVVRVVQRDGHIEGFLAVRPGARAVQIGPCIATPVAGPLLFMDVARRFAGRLVYIDVPTANIPARAMAETMGLTVQRHLLRMGRGQPVQEMVDHLWASSGPEKG